MYVIEHALLNLGKNKGRNILLGVIIFAIITATVVALAIFNTTGIIIDETRETIESLTPDEPQTTTSGGGKLVTGGQPQQQTSVEAALYKKALEQTESLQRLALMFLIIVLTLGVVIMVLLSVIAIRERKYEIGVLRAMGMKKKHVALSLWVEIMAITCICFVLGLGAGTALSQPVSDSMIRGITQTEATGSTSLADRVSGTDSSQQESIDVSVNGVTSLEIFVVSLLLASIAGIISVSRITKSEPIKILMERS